MTGLLTVFALGAEKISHWFFLLIAFLNGVFLLLESRRLSLFLAHRRRIRLLERGFYCEEILLEEEASSTELRKIPDWEPQLVESMLQRL